MHIQNVKLLTSAVMHHVVQAPDAETTKEHSSVLVDEDLLVIHIMRDVGRLLNVSVMMIVRSVQNVCNLRENQNVKMYVKMLYVEEMPCVFP